MSWLTDNMGMVVFFAILLLVVLTIVGLTSGKFPALLDSIRAMLGV